MAANRGQRVEVQITSGRWSTAIVTNVDDPENDIVSVVVYTDGVSPWPTPETPNGTIDGSISGVEKGSGVGEWRELPLPSAEEAAIATIAASSVSLVGYATQTYCDDGIAASALGLADDIDTARDSRVAAPASCGYSVSLALGTARNPSSVRSDTRPTHVTAIVSWAAALTGSASAQIVCDSNSSPTTVVLTVPFSATLALGVQAAVPVVIPFEVPAGWSYKIQAGAGSSGTLTLASVLERAL